MKKTFRANHDIRYKYTAYCAELGGLYHVLLHVLLARLTYELFDYGQLPVSTQDPYSTM